MSLKKFARGLLATTCLTVAAGAAQAGTFTETTDFGNTYAAATSLPPGTDVVNGTLTWPGDMDDFVRFSGLVGTSYTLTETNASGLFSQLSVFSSSNGVTPIGGPVGVGSSGSNSVSGAIPGDGVLIVDVHNGEGSGGYSLNLQTSGVPEPSTLGGVGIALAASLAMRRRQKK